MKKRHLHQDNLRAAAGNAGSWPVRCTYRNEKENTAASGPPKASHLVPRETWVIPAHQPKTDFV